MTNTDLNGKLPPVSQKIAERRMRLTGYCVRHPEKMAFHLVVWESIHAHSSRKRRPVSYIDNIRSDWPGGRAGHQECDGGQRELKWDCQWYSAGRSVD